MECARGYERRFGEFLRGLIEEAVGERAAKLAPAVSLLVEGAIVTAAMEGKPDAVDAARPRGRAASPAEAQTERAGVLGKSMAVPATLLK